MTPRQKQIIQALKSVTFPPATNQKRFAKNMIFLCDHSPERELSPKQEAYLQILAWRYRRQMPADLAYPRLPEEVDA